MLLERIQGGRGVETTYVKREKINRLKNEVDEPGEKHESQITRNNDK